jgi:hypothetical protein
MKDANCRCKDESFAFTRVSAVEAEARDDIPRRLLQRLDELGALLAQRGDALALLGLGSVGVDVGRLDDHSDMDFFVVVDDDAKQRYLDSIDWLEQLAPVVFSFPNSVDGRKVLFADGLFAEYAVFTLGELRGAAYPPGRIVWKRSDAPAGLESAGRMPEPSPQASAGHQANEALTNLYVGLHRDLRGERLSAMRLIQVHAVDRLLTFLHLTEPAAGRQQDVFGVERGAERCFGPEALPLVKFAPGYERNREAALAILEWLEVRAEVNDVLAAEIRRLAVEPGD